MNNKDEVFLPKDRTPDQRWADAGQMMSVFCADPRYRDLTGQSLFIKIMPALSAGQYAIVRRPMTLEGSDQTLPGPVAAVLWARVSDDIHAGFLAATEIPRVSLGDWNSGDHFWIIDAPGDPRIAGKAVEALQRSQFGRNVVNVFVFEGPGKLTIRQLGG